MNSSRTFGLVALFVCCGAAPSGAGTSGENEDAGQPPPAMAQRAPGGVGATGTASSPRFSRLHCRRYFGCTPAHRSAIGFTQD
jgi:hypothetical protein